jgi:oligopeptide transport system substrate-binding protein
LAIIVWHFGFRTPQNSESPASVSPELPAAQADASILRVPVLSGTALATLDPIQSVELIQFDVVSQIFETLMRVDVDGAVVGGLAAKITPNERFDRWEVTLRDAEFADSSRFPEGKGRPITAKDVADSLTRSLNVAAGSKGAWVLSANVLGAKEYSEGKASAVSGIAVVDERRLEVSLIKPDQFFPASLTIAATAIVPLELTDATFATLPVGSGPYQVEQWVQGQRLTLKANPKHPAISAESPQRIELLFFRNEAQMSSALTEKNIDLRPVTGADLISAEALSGATSAAQGRLLNAGNVIKTHLLAVDMKSTSALRTQVELRHQLGAALRDRISELNALEGVGVRQDFVLPNAFRVGLETPAATKVAIPAGALKGQNVRIAYATNRLNDIIIGLLREVIEAAGGSVTLFPSPDISAMFGSLAAAKPDLTLIYWSPYVPTVTEYVSALLTTAQPVPNFTGYSNPIVDAVAEELRAGAVGEAQAAARLHQALEDTLPWIPLYTEQSMYIVGPRVAQFALAPNSVSQFAAARLAR